MGSHGSLWFERLLDLIDEIDVGGGAQSDDERDELQLTARQLAHRALGAPRGIPPQRQEGSHD